MNTETNLPQADKISVACSCAYLLAGFSIPDLPLTTFQEDNGHTGVVERLAEFAVLMEDWLLTTEAKEVAVYGFPGVFYYEIVEPLGKWVHEEAVFEADEFMAEFKARFTQWMNNGH